MRSAPAAASDADLLAEHRYFLEQACTVLGPSCIIIHRVLARLALEILDRGLQTIHLTALVRDHFRNARQAWLN